MHYAMDMHFKYKDDQRNTGTECEIRIDNTMATHKIHWYNIQSLYVLKQDVYTQRTQMSLQYIVNNVYCTMYIYIYNIH